MIGGSDFTSPGWPAILRHLRKQDGLCNGEMAERLKALPC